MSTETGLFKVIETDTMTGWDRYLDNMKTKPWSGTFTREQADASVEWRKKNITSRYAYRIVPVEPHMTDNDAARTRHQERHGSHRMEDCSNVDCREAAMRLMHEDLDRRFAAADRGETGWTSRRDYERLPVREDRAFPIADEDVTDAGDGEPNGLDTWDW